MDRALEDVITERTRSERGRGGRGARGPRRDNWPRESARKNGGGNNNNSNIDDDWIHDKFEEGDDIGSRGPRLNARGRGFRDRDSPEADLIARPVKVRVENLHYDLTEDELEDLFTRIGPIKALTLTYDRAGRSTGTAYVNYFTIVDARKAVAEFDGANAAGQPIRLSIIPSGPSGPRNSSARGGRNPFNTAVKPSRSIFDRIDDGRLNNGGRGNRDRSRSPRRSDTTKPPPEGIDRYVPGDRSRSPPRRRRQESGRGGDRKGDGGRRAGGDGVRRDDGGRGGGRSRPRPTQDELDRDMDSYFSASKDGGAAQPAVAKAVDDDIDMVE